jgi:hypothetical protein
MRGLFPALRVDCVGLGTGLLLFGLVFAEGMVYRIREVVLLGEGAGG